MSEPWVIATSVAAGVLAGLVGFVLYLWGSDRL